MCPLFSEEVCVILLSQRHVVQIVYFILFFLKYGELNISDLKFMTYTENITFFVLCIIGDLLIGTYLKRTE